MKWLVRLARALGYSILAAIIVLLLYPTLSMVGVLTAAWIGDTTGWYRVEDYMCTIPEGCKEYIAERKRLREQNRPPPK